MTENQCQQILVFFRLSLLNPLAAESAAAEAYYNLEKGAKQRDETPFETRFVRITHEIHHRLRQSGQKGKKLIEHPVELAGIDLSPWRDFVRHAPDEETLSLLWVQVLNLPIKAVAAALDVTEGTIRHRLSRAIRKLARKIDPVEIQGLKPRRPWK